MDSSLGLIFLIGLLIWLFLNEIYGENKIISNFVSMIVGE